MENTILTCAVELLACAWYSQGLRSAKKQDQKTEVQVIYHQNSIHKVQHPDIHGRRSLHILRQNLAHWSIMQSSYWALAGISWSEKVDVSSECTESLWILFCSLSRLATRRKEAGLEAVSSLLGKGDATSERSCLVRSSSSKPWRKWLMLSSVGAASAEAATDTHEAKGTLFPGMSDVVENNKLAPVTLLTASSAIFT